MDKQVKHSFYSLTDLAEEARSNKIAFSIFSNGFLIQHSASPWLLFAVAAVLFINAAHTAHSE